METKMKNKKIAIMTWHHTDNYGTGFQVYALSYIIKAMGYSVDIIDYRRFNELPLQKRSIFKLIVYIFKRKGKGVFYSNIDDFNEFYEKFFSYTKRCNSYQDLEKLSESYDAIVCGSDQIWSPDGLDERFFLDFAPKQKIIAYAPSFGITSVDNIDLAERIGALINRFSYVSIRESSGCELAKKLANRDDVINVLDPVLLLDNNVWNNIMKKELEIEKPYMLIFFLKNNKKYFERSLLEAKKRNLSTIVLHSTQSEDNNYSNIDNPSPEELLWLISNADFVCTDSFHFSVLSIIFNIQFHVFFKDKINYKLSRNSRMIDLLSNFNIVEHSGMEFCNKDIDFEKVNKLLYEQRKTSIAFLHSALEKATQIEKTEKLEHKSCNQVECKGGMDYDEFVYRKKNSHFFNKFLINRMQKWDFTLKESCYGCKNYNKNKKNNFRRPLFYDELKRDLLEKSIVGIYLKYYFLYDIPYIIKNIVRR